MQGVPTALPREWFSGPLLKTASGTELITNLLLSLLGSSGFFVKSLNAASETLQEPVST